VLFGRGSLREAWAACFTGTLGAFSRYRGIIFPPEATEYDCLGLVRNSGLDAAAFTGLVENWIAFAYGGKEPSREAFEQALVFGKSLAAGEPL
jgi:hypothetical protein